MKKVITFLCICCLIFSALPSAHAVPRVKSTATPEPQQSPLPQESEKSIGPIEEIMGVIAVYCNRWDNTIGKSFKEDISFDSDTYSVLKTNFDPQADEDDELFFLWDMDGVLIKTNLKLEIFSVSVKITDTECSAMKVVSRICAMISALAYDFPRNEKEFKSRFIELSNEYTDFLDDNWSAAMDGNIVPWNYSSPNGDYTFYLFFDDEFDLYLSTSEKLF